MSQPRPRQPGERAFTLALLALSLFLLYQAYTISGFSAVSSPGVFPMVAAGVMVLSLATVLVRERGRPDPAGFVRQVTPPVLLGSIVLIVGLMVTLEPAGFVAAAGGFLFATILFLQRGRPVRAALVAAVAVVAIYVVFRIGFQVVLPEAGWM
ncbi:MAG: tripartite tricarboxylate transporter TctB family protein [Thalassobaculum sp.]|uniref:tripartite tricarboxylate transporter TctB family protein n=1 Tax=Thalassobaculum sp. TaxID=2022740 RepID=UPI0032ECA8A7